MVAPSASSKRARKRRSEPLFWPPLKIGLRRPAAEAPENTFPLFDLALREGAEGIAIDVQLSADGVPVVICDARSSRTHSGSGQGQKHQANALLQLDASSWLNRRFSSRARRQYVHTRVRLLSDVLRWVRDQKCMAFVAISNSTPGAEAKVIREIGRAKVRHLTRVIAPSLPGLRLIRQLDAKVHLGLRFSGRPPAIERAKALGAEVLLPHWKATSPSFIRGAHRASMLVIPWTVDSPRQMRTTIREGVDGIITNYPAKLTEAVARLQKTGRAAMP